MDSSVSARGNPFIGSRISLLSKSQMRYEGVLYQLDEDQSTLALAKVRSFGTEDRVPDRPVPPRDELFDYIVFRAMDIQDIKLSEAPKHPKTLPGGLSFDPAIIQCLVQVGESHLPPVGSGLLNSGTMPRPPSSSLNQAAASYDPLEGLGHTKVGDLLSDLVRSRRNTSPSVRIDESVQNAATATTAQPGGDPMGNQQRGMANGGNRNPRFNNGGRRGSIQVQRPPMNFIPPAYMMRGAYRGPQSYNYYRRPIIPYRGQYTTWNRGGGYGNFRPNWNQGYRNYQPRRNQSQPRMFTKDYDFERANTKFERIKAKTEKKDETTAATNSEDKPETEEPKINGDVETEATDEVEKLVKSMEAVSCYDKGKSFFDRISCEADAKRERKDKRREMAINKQTFGIKPAFDYQRVPSLNYYYGRNNYVTYRGGRGGSYGGGFGGSYNYGYRGGRGGYRGRYMGRITMTSRLMEGGN